MFCFVFLQRVDPDTLPLLSPTSRISSFRDCFSLAVVFSLETMRQLSKSVNLDHPEEGRPSRCPCCRCPATAAAAAAEHHQ